jgi:hypothetical protein
VPTGRRSAANILAELFRQHSFRLEKISGTTFPHDILVRMSYITKEQVAAVEQLIRGGVAFRCRIANHRYYFGRTVSEAAEAALAAYKESNGKKGRKKKAG